MLSAFILIQAFLTLASADDARLELRASHPRPFAGQEIELALDIHLPAGTLSPHLEIPWLSGEFGFDWALPPEQWLCEHSDVDSDIRINNWPMPVKAEKINDRRFRLRWKLIPRAADDSSPNVLRFEQILLKLGNKTFFSDVLELPVRDVPSPPADAAGLNLGVGAFQLEMSIEPKEIEFGQETTLTLKISGANGLENLSRPDLRRLPEFKEFLIADGTETWAEDESSRLFQYQVKPRNAGVKDVPTIFYSFFDPIQEVYQTRATATAALSVHPKTENIAGPTPLTLPPDLIPDRYRLVPIQIFTDDLWPTTSVMIGILCIPFLIMLVAIAIDRHRGLRRINHRRMIRYLRKRVARTHLRRLRRLRNSPAVVAAPAISEIIRQYLRSRVVEIHLCPNLTVKYVHKALADHGVPASTTVALIQLLQECEAIAYGPDGETKDDLTATAQRLIVELRDLP